MGKLIKVTLLRSAVGRQKVQAKTLRGMGLTRQRKTVYLENTSTNRGMVYAVRHLVAAEAVTEAQRDAELAVVRKPSYRIIKGN